MTTQRKQDQESTMDQTTDQTTDQAGTSEVDAAAQPEQAKASPKSAPDVIKLFAKDTASISIEGTEYPGKKSRAGGFVFSIPSEVVGRHGPELRAHGFEFSAETAIGEE